MAAKDRADGLRAGRADRGDVEAELEPRTTPRDPGHAIAEAAAGQVLAVGGGRERDAGVRMEVVDMGGVDQPVHRGVDRWRRAAAAVQAVVERGDHLVLALDAGIDVHERAQPVEPKDREPGLGQRAEVAAGPLDPQQVDRRPGRRIDARSPWPRCCRRRSSCSAGRRPGGSSGPAGPRRAPFLTVMRPSPRPARRRVRRRSSRHTRTVRYAASGPGRGRPPRAPRASSGRTSVS